MIKANELRIGNRVLFRGKEDTVWRVEDNNYYTENYGHGVNNKDLEPIPLCDDWLLKFGFEYISSNRLVYNNEIVEFTFDGVPMLNGVFVLNVHTLQNLYFALTGEELTIKD